MPLYFPGFPGGLNTQVQFNDGGRFGGDAGLTFAKATDYLSVEGFLNVGPDQTLYDSIKFYLNDAQTDLTTQDLFASFIFVELNPAVNATKLYRGQFIEIDLIGSHNHGVASTFSSHIKFTGSGSADSPTGYYTQISNLGLGTIGNAYSVYIDTPENSGGGVFTNYFAFYSSEILVGTNPYYLWFDSDGVFRIREDNTFNSVGQAIAALYNPQFAKYVAGAVNFERGILAQWNSNVLEIGAEAGGTGTLRAVKIIGASLQATSYKSNDGSTGATGSANATNTLTIKNGLVTNIA